MIGIVRMHETEIISHEGRSGFDNNLKRGIRESRELLFFFKRGRVWGLKGYNYL